MRKVTKLWKCKDGTKIRICDMTDLHLQNAMRLLESAAHKQEQAFILSAPAFNGDIAEYMHEQEQDRVLEEGLDVDEVYPIYGFLQDEAERRGLT